MSTGQMVVVALAALLVFWTLGAYNRLVELRNQIIAAWAQVDEPLQRRAAAVTPLVSGLRMHLPDEQGALDAVQAINARALPTLALDLPSGVCASTGQLFTDAVHADVTVTFHRPKLGLRHIDPSGGYGL